MPRAVRVHETGGPEVLRLEEWDPGEPGAGELRVRVRAAGVNFLDIYFRTGLYPPELPFVCGFEGAGEVEAVGADVSGFAVGDRVAWALGPGSYADALLLSASSAVPIPDLVSERGAAAALLQGMTAHYLTHGVRETRAGDVALVHAAAGGTGLLLVQMLKRAGARVIGTCSTAEKAECARKAGADHVIRYGEENFAEVTRQLTEGRGVDVVYDSVGQATFEGSLGCLRAGACSRSSANRAGRCPPSS